MAPSDGQLLISGDRCTAGLQEAKEDIGGLCSDVQQREADIEEGIERSLSEVAGEKPARVCAGLELLEIRPAVAIGIAGSAVVAGCRIRVQPILHLP